MGVGACAISGGMLTLGTALGAGKREGMVGAGACAASGGMLTLELDSGAVGHG